MKITRIHKRKLEATRKITRIHKRKLEATMKIRYTKENLKRPAERQLSAPAEKAELLKNCFDLLCRGGGRPVVGEARHP